jgi:hypothetical protein
LLSLGMEYKKVTVFSKAEKAAIAVKNMKVEKLNAFYTYHKEIIDEFLRLEREVEEANSNYITAQINAVNDKFMPKKKQCK